MQCSRAHLKRARTAPHATSSRSRSDNGLPRRQAADRESHTAAVEWRGSSLRESCNALEVPSAARHWPPRPTRPRAHAQRPGLTLWRFHMRSNDSPHAAVLLLPLDFGDGWPAVRRGLISHVWRPRRRPLDHCGWLRRRRCDVEAAMHHAKLSPADTISSAESGQEACQSQGST